MSLCNVCHKDWCGCGGGAVCANCKQKMKEKEQIILQINQDPVLSEQEKIQKIQSLNVNNQ